MKLKEIAIGYIEIPLVTPFKTALRTVNSVNDLIVKVTAEDGTEGYGEAPPTAVITGDTKESIEAAIRYYIAPAITGHGSGRSAWLLWQKWKSALPKILLQRQLWILRFMICMQNCRKNRCSGFLERKIHKR